MRFLPNMGEKLNVIFNLFISFTTYGAFIETFQACLCVSSYEKDTFNILLAWVASAFKFSYLMFTIIDSAKGIVSRKAAKSLDFYRLS